MFLIQSGGLKLSNLTLSNAWNMVQFDAANLTNENIDRQSGVLVYRRKKLGDDSEPARLTIGNA